MWPFPPKQSTPVIPDRLHRVDEPPRPGLPGSAADAAKDMGTVRSVDAAIRRVHALSLPHVKTLYTEASSLSGKLSGLLPDLDAPRGNLGRFGGSVDAAYQRLKNTIGQSPDIIVRKLTLGRQLQWPALLAFADGMASNQVVDRDTVMVSELYDATAAEIGNVADLHTTVLRRVLAAGHVTTADKWDSLLDKLTYGSTLLFIEGSTDVLVIDTVKFEARAIGRAKSEPSVKGPQEAFNEILLTHMNQIRRRVKSPWLHFDPITVGGYTSTTILVTHIEGLTNPALVAAVKDRIHAIRRDSVQDLAEITTYLAERRSLFPQFRMTERVDFAVRDLIRGKVLIIVDNTPFVASLPSTLMDFYQTTQDYVFSSWDGTLVRLVRFIGLTLSLYLMPLYIALFSVDPDLVPTKLVLTVAGARLGIPFPPVVEVVVMWVIIEILREASNRLPSQLATTLGTVGAVVVGTAIVKAGIVDPIMIVMVTLTALAMFTTPAFELTAAWRWLFWALILGAYIFGVLGIFMVSVVIVTYLASLEPFGAPYLMPFGPLSFKDLRDTILRAPLAWFRDRPTHTRAVDVTMAGGDITTPHVPLVNTQRRIRH